MHVLKYLCHTECVLLLQNVFSYYRMCSLTTECVLLLQNVFSYACTEISLSCAYAECQSQPTARAITECVLLHNTECVLLLQNVFSYITHTYLSTCDQALQEIEISSAPGT